MLSERENQELTQVAGGTPMGELLRRYWQPIAAAGELDKKPTKEVTVLGEELVLYKDRSGTLGLIGRRCAHRRVSLVYGVPEADGLRCQYHGWKYDETGRCLEAPFEDTVNPQARFKDRVSLPAYPVQELGGLVFAYLGPRPAPLLPRWAPLTWENAVRDIAFTVLPCNWLQCQENSLDPVHVEWLHGHYSDYMREVAGLPSTRSPETPPMSHEKIAFDQFDYGIIKRRVLKGYTEEDDDWKVGHPILFPHILLVGSEVSATLQFRVPIDDSHTFHVSLYTWKAAPGSTAPVQDRVPYRYVPLRNEDGSFSYQTATFNQDYMAWSTQGDVARRDLEKLGESDLGLIMYRKLLKQQMDLVQDGGDPMCVIRDPDENECLDAPLERIKFGNRIRRMQYSPAEGGYSDDGELINQVLATWADYAAVPA
ncbi:MAG TPA: aromatic ring-hydroxylating dioxygenase subunit alpha [Dehalococcoidia bacterium]|nr:aromatic ring-hydroxylating dioxygenase subunit alpha [Dehalococcoidia bacterium]